MAKVKVQFTELGQSLQVFQPGDCDAILLKVQSSELGEALDDTFHPASVTWVSSSPNNSSWPSASMFQPGVADLGLPEFQPSELGQSRKIRHPVVLDLGFVKSQPFKSA